MSTGAQIPQNLLPYDSYATDPKWQKKFTIIWTSVMAFGVLISLPYLFRSIRRGRAFTGILGISESWARKPYISLRERQIQHKSGRWKSITRVLSSTLFWTIPRSEINLGQLIVVIGYLVTVVLCIVLKSDLTYNSNRGGFLALAQLPVVFLFATKNSVLSLLLGPGHGYEKLNIVHRWAGRGLFLAAAIHGSLWIKQHLQYSIPILGQQKETSGVASFSLLCLIILTSLRPFRRLFYQGFFVVHILGYSAFFITICTHTPYAPPWIFPPIAFYGLDLLLRMLRYRIKDATLIPIDSHMTLVHVHNCDEGWQAGQHVRLRVFFSGRVFESHPLTILNAPSPMSSVSVGTLTLGARAVGDWTRSLNQYARQEMALLSNKSEKEKYGSGVPIQVMIDGPYGGCSIDLGDFESVLLISGGSGATFTLGLLDDIVTRCVKQGRQNGERTKRIEFAWCIRSFGCIDWFAPMLAEIANTVSGTSLDLHISIYVTCLCEPQMVPKIPNSVITLERPSVQNLLHGIIASSGDNQDLKWVSLGGGLGVCVGGPESLTTEVSNAVARLSLSRGVELGGIELHTELFAL